ncbi:uncharacterized protein [Physcomitrium patens]|uniref:Uncharacterized protein n=1 Tax=Physcomitrium patens TaxID=3218 RepID=A0A2K1K382_PHYPA|nr:uncharacterized protein LOC112286343 [Physcomitrium patens]PNR48227.1 hypothetical protein PHYPA_012702 [Physcomitrium patens]|eukprot:XP_024383903.1 uncharacterized protein LOC112286343 [Physcomitrella patens]
MLLPAGTSSSNSLRPTLRFTQQRTWSSQVSGHRARVTAEYRRGGVGDFMAGFFLGGVVFGALGYVLAPQITKSLEGTQKEKEDELDSKKSMDMEDDESLETTRKNLNERIAQLSAAIDDVSAQVKNDVQNTVSEIESPVGL